MRVWGYLGGSAWLGGLRAYVGVFPILSFVLVKAAPFGWLHFSHIPLHTIACHWQPMAREVFDPASGPPMMVY